MKKKDCIIPLCLLTVGVILVVLGICRGEHNTVFEKATKICLECMGIG